MAKIVDAFKSEEIVIPRLAFIELDDTIVRALQRGEGLETIVARHGVTERHVQRLSRLMCRSKIVPDTGGAR